MQLSCKWCSVSTLSEFYFPQYGSSVYVACNFLCVTSKIGTMDKKLANNPFNPNLSMYFNSIFHLTELHTVSENIIGATKMRNPLGRGQPPSPCFRPFTWFPLNNQSFYLDCTIKQSFVFSSGKEGDHDEFIYLLDQQRQVIEKQEQLIQQQKKYIESQAPILFSDPVLIQKYSMSLSFYKKL